MAVADVAFHGRDHDRFTPAVGSSSMTSRGSAIRAAAKSGAYAAEESWAAFFAACSDRRNSASMSIACRGCRPGPGGRTVPSVPIRRYDEVFRHGELGKTLACWNVLVRPRRYMRRGVRPVAWWVPSKWTSPECAAR